MLRPVVLAVVASLVSCSPMNNTVTTQSAGTAPSMPARYEPAPVVTQANFALPPDLRDKVCGDAQDQGSSYATITKSSNSLCR
jgi:hypothetical protein